MKSDITNQLQVLQARLQGLQAEAGRVASQREDAQQVLDTGDTQVLPRLAELQAQAQALSLSIERTQAAIAEQQAALNAALQEEQRAAWLAEVEELNEVAQAEADAMRAAYAELERQYENVIQMRHKLWGSEQGRIYRGQELARLLKTSEPFPFTSGVGFLGQGTPLGALVSATIQSREERERMAESSARLREREKAREKAEQEARERARAQAEQEAREMEVQQARYARELESQRVSLAS